MCPLDGGPSGLRFPVIEPRLFPSPQRVRSLLLHRVGPSSVAGRWDGRLWGPWSTCPRSPTPKGPVAPGAVVVTPGESGRPASLPTHRPEGLCVCAGFSLRGHGRRGSRLDGLLRGAGGGAGCPPGQTDRPAPGELPTSSPRAPAGISTTLLLRSGSWHL